MPINNFHGNTFVAYCDISGFKRLMEERERAVKALDKFYSIGYDLIERQNPNNEMQIEPLFISDCGILFVRGGDMSPDTQLAYLLENIESLNRQMSNQDFMLTTSIAYGHFQFHNRFEIQGIEKNPICGQAYVNAFLDNECGQPKITPGQCRIVRAGLPSTMNILNDNYISQSNEHDMFPHKKNLFQRIRPFRNSHFHFYWMVNRPSDIDEFERRYKNSYDNTYRGMSETLKHMIGR